jgi:acyl-coenzyme A synthetase/AMP-(fatty) acid ligase
MAFAILHPQHASKWKGRHEEFAKDLIAHAKKKLPGFACPEWVEVVPELPKTSTGKILKTELRKMVAKL